MTQNELKTLKMNLLGGMNEYVKHLNDEEAYFRWIYFVPDECDEEDLAYIADDPEEWAIVCNLFGLLVSTYIKNGEV